MSRTTEGTTEMRVVCTGFLTTHHRFWLGDRALGELIMPAFRQGNVFRAGNGQDRVMRQPHWLSAEHEMCQGDRVRARAQGPGLLSSSVKIEFEGQTYILEPAGFLSEKWRLVDAHDRALLSVEPQGCLRREVRLYMPPGIELDLDLVVFAYYLVHVCREETAAACAAVG